MRRITGAAALGYVVLAAVENIELLGLPGPGAPASPRRRCSWPAASLLGGVGVALWIDPGAFSLAPLGGRFAGSWVAMLATLAAYAALTDRRRDARLPALALIALPAGALVAGARTGAPAAYLLALALLVAAGAAVLAVSEAPGGAARRARSARTPGPLGLPARPSPGPTVQT